MAARASLVPPSSGCCSGARWCCVAGAGGAARSGAEGVANGAIDAAGVAATGTALVAAASEAGASTSIDIASACTHRNMLTFDELEHSDHVGHLRRMLGSSGRNTTRRPAVFQQKAVLTEGRCRGAGTVCLAAQLRKKNTDFITCCSRASSSIGSVPVVAAEAPAPSAAAAPSPAAPPSAGCPSPVPKRAHIVTRLPTAVAHRDCGRLCIMLFKSKPVYRGAAASAQV